jgi:LysR family glycine cleavage system transcriptional activator
MARRLPPLSAIKAFEAAARLSSFSRAAAELNVTHAAISRHVRALEAEFRTPLFERTGRGVVLTDAGQSLSLELTKGLDLIASAVVRFSRPTRRRRQLVVTSDVSFAMLWLVPRLGKFTSLHPAIDIVLDSSNRVVDFAKEDVDLGIRCGGGPWDHIDARKLASGDLMPVCSPDFLRNHSLSSPSDLDGSFLIQEAQKQYWNAWLEAAGIADRVIPLGPTLNGELAIAAAEAGQGLALADQILAGDSIASGRLVRPFDVVTSCYGYHLVRRAGAKTSEVAAAFESWLVAELEASATTFARTKKLAQRAVSKTGSQKREARRRGSRRASRSVA